MKVNTTKKSPIYLQIQKNIVTLQAQMQLVPWMSGLVNGLQNRLRRFESARHLNL